MLIPAGRTSRSALQISLAADTQPSSAAASLAGEASCAPAMLNRSAVVGGLVTVSPLPESRDASPATQISLRGVPAAQLAEIAVSGSRSGRHPGRLLAYSQGDGASFVPSRPFSPGETVSVHGAVLSGSTRTNLAFSFTVAVPDTFGEAGGSPAPPAKPSDFQSFRSRGDLKPPKVTVTAHSAAASPGEVLLAPYSGPGQYGPMILDEKGGLIWFKPLSPSGARAADLRVQSWEGKPVLTWWQDPLVTATSHKSGIVIADSSYKVIHVVRAGNGYQADLHEFRITPNGSALITVYDGIDCNLSAIGGPAAGAVADTLMQEVDIRTGLVRYEWHSLDHVPLTDAYVAPHPGSQKEPFDFFHINSVDPQHDGSLLIDARNTWSAYDVDQRTGRVLWQIGGKHSSYKLGPGAMTAFQHDARQQANGNLTFFDNGATPAVHPQSRAIELSLRASGKTATLTRRVEHSPSLIAGSQGNLQVLEDGDWMIGWGQAPWFSEYAPNGRVLFDAHLPPGYESYRTFRQEWSAQPSVPPSFAYVPSGAGAGVYASWNGATGVASWRVLAGGSASAMTPLTTRARSGFETAHHSAAGAGRGQLHRGPGAQPFGWRSRCFGPEAPLSAGRSRGAGGPWWSVSCPTVSSERVLRRVAALAAATRAVEK